jgi:hypothetical protein
MIKNLPNPSRCHLGITVRHGKLELEQSAYINMIAGKSVLEGMQNERQVHVIKHDQIFGRILERSPGQWLQLDVLLYRLRLITKK